MKVLKYFFAVLIIIGLVIIVGTAGASDNNAISDYQLIIQSAIGLLCLIIGGIGSSKMEVFEDENRRQGKNY